jgi:glycosyltransferase involved in cell wall biosynthesis
MRIAILAERLLPGSIPKVIGAEYKYLIELGHEVEAVTIMEADSPLQSYEFQEFMKGVSIRELSREFPLIKHIAFKLPFFSFLSSYHLIGPLFAPHVIKRGEYDVIIALGTLTCLTAYGIWRRRKIPYVAYDWDPFSYILSKVYSRRLPKTIFYPLFRVASWFDKFIVQNSLVTVTLSQIHADMLRSLTDEKNIEIVYMGCNHVERIPEKRGDYLLAIDRWDRGNMPHILLEIMERLKEKAHLIVAGFCSEGWIERSFLKLREKKRLTERVKWLGPVSEEELKKLYLGSRAWVHPIEETSVSMPALEAAGHGCPIVMPKWTPLFSHGVHGFFSAEGNLDEYAEYVDRLLGDERLAWRMGYEAWKVAKKYTWEYHAKRLEEIILKHAMFKG